MLAEYEGRVRDGLGETGFPTRGVRVLVGGHQPAALGRAASVPHEAAMAG